MTTTSASLSQCDGRPSARACSTPNPVNADPVSAAAPAPVAVDLRNWRRETWFCSRLSRFMSAILVEDFFLFLAQDDMPGLDSCQPRTQIPAAPNSDEAECEKS